MKSKAKVGRNPFETEMPRASVTPKFDEAPQANPADEARETSSSTSKSDSADKAGFFDRLEGALSWKLRQFSVLRYESGAKSGQIALLSVSLENPQWKSRRAFDLKLVRSRSWVLNALSVRIHSA